MKSEESGIWVSDRETFAQGLRAFLWPVVNEALLLLSLMLLGAGVVVWVFQVPAVEFARAMVGYLILQVFRGLWWLYQPRLPWQKRKDA